MNEDYIISSKENAHSDLKMSIYPESKGKHRAEDLPLACGYAHAIQFLYVGGRRSRGVVREEVEVKPVPVFDDELHGSFDRFVTQINGAVHVEDHTSLFGDFHKGCLPYLHKITADLIYCIYLH